jgi:hypothetical protein
METAFQIMATCSPQLASRALLIIKAAGPTAPSLSNNLQQRSVSH